MTDKPIGRPSSYTDEVAARICERLAGGETLRGICEDEGMPVKATVFRWLRSNQEFRDQYTRARDDQAETFMDELVAIADDTKLDWQDRKVRISTRQWAMSKLAPKRYGEKVTHAGDPDAPLVPQTSDADFARRLAFLLTKGAAEAGKDGA